MPVSKPIVTQTLAGQVAFPQVVLDAGSLELLTRLSSECAAAVFVGRCVANHGAGPMTEDERIGVVNLLKDALSNLSGKDAELARALMQTFSEKNKEK